MMNTSHRHIHDDPDDHDNKKREASEKAVYKNLPVHFTCPNCDYTGYTIVEQKTTYISYVLMILFIFLFGIFFSIILMPLVILLTRSFFHKCPSCFKDVASDNKILSILDMQDKMISFNIGEFGLVLTRKIIFGFFLTVLLCITVYVKLDFTGHHHHGPIIPIKESWEQVLNECGRSAIEEHKVERMRQCESKYLEKTVINWRGYVIRVEDFRNSLYSFMHHALVIPLKMTPSESEFFPDVILALDSEIANSLNDMILSLNKGTEVSFNATIINLGHDRKTRHMHVVDMRKESGFMEVSELVHSQGRYADKPQFLRVAAGTSGSNNALPPAPSETKKEEEEKKVVPEIKEVKKEATAEVKEEKKEVVPEVKEEKKEVVPEVKEEKKEVVPEVKEEKKETAPEANQEKQVPEVKEEKKETD